MAKIVVLQHHPAENLGAIADALEEAAPCVDKDAGHYVTQEHHDNIR